MIDPNQNQNKTVLKRVQINKDRLWHRRLSSVITKELEAAELSHRAAFSPKNSLSSPGAVAGRTNPMCKEPWLCGHRRA